MARTDEYLEKVSEVSFQEAGNKWMRELPEEASEIGRKEAMALEELIASGRVRRNFAFRGRLMWHDEGSHRHFHRSLAEMSRCNELHESIGPPFLNPNLCFRGIEPDWVVSKDPERFEKDNPLTWNQVIEYHPLIRTWRGERSNQDDYECKRIEQIMSRGIKCEVRFIE